jgi:hypothetical protein
VGKITDANGDRRISKEDGVMNFVDRAEQFLAILNEASPEKRDQLIAEVLAPNIVYVDPHVPAPVKGRDGFAAFARRFRELVQGVTVSLDDEPQHHNGFGRIRYKILRGNEPFSRGAFFVDLNPAQQFERIVGFVD